MYTKGTEGREKEKEVKGRGGGVQELVEEGQQQQFQQHG